MREIRVLVVEDSFVFRELLVQNLNKQPGMAVVAAAKDPYEARDAIIQYRPDVMTLDIELPRMNGIEFLQKLMPQYPLPVVVLSSLSEKVFDAMSAGAVDFVAKPMVSDREQIADFIQNELPSKIKIAANAKINRTKQNAFKQSSQLRLEPHKNQDFVIAIGASTGGTEATSSVLEEFESDFPGVVITQHMPEGFTKMYAKRLNDKCRMTVKEAENGDRIENGKVLVSPGGQMQTRIVKVNGIYQVECKPGEKVNGHRPSVDVLFDSVAEHAGKHALGIILTGMGSDGAKGLRKMREAGAHTVGQDESTCVVYGMPKAAFQLGAVEYQEKLLDIPKRVYSIINT